MFAEKFGREQNMCSKLSLGTGDNYVSVLQKND